MLVILKHVMLALIGGVVAAWGLTWYLHHEDPWSLRNKQPVAEEVAVALPSRDELADKAVDVLGPERVQQWLNGVLQQLLDESGSLAGSPPAPDADAESNPENGL